MFTLKVVLAVVIGLPFAAVGLALSLTGIGAVLGVPLMFVSGLPLGILLKRHEEAKCRLKMQGRPMMNESQVPWLLEEIEPDDSV